MKAREHANEWLQYSNRDLESARFLMNMRPAPLEIICVHSQQTAEKALKSILANFDQDIPRIHDLERLKALLLNLTPSLLINSADLKRLNSYGAEFRYPFSPEISESQALEALAAAERVLVAVKAVLD